MHPRYTCLYFIYSIVISYTTIIDHVLVEGDKIYLNAYNNGLIPREELLSLNNLPTVVSLSIETNISSVEAQNKNNLPVVVEPVEAQNIIDLPIVVEPIKSEYIQNFSVAY